MAVPSFSLEKKIALVTGASRGIGKAIALGFARVGADVVVCSRTLPDLEKAAEEIRASGRRSLAVPANIAIKADVDSLIERTVQEFGTIDILVNNAAMNIARPVLELREDGWDKVMNTGLKGYFLCSQAAAKVMVERKRGNIINIASTAAVKAAPLLGVYSISKAGVVMLTKLFAADLARHNIRVNAVGPSMVKTKFSEPLWASPEALSRIESEVPLGRLAEVDDIVGAAIFLASDASSYITGHTIWVDGGVLA